MPCSGRPCCCQSCPPLTSVALLAQAPARLYSTWPGTTRSANCSLCLPACMLSLTSHLCPTDPWQPASGVRWLAVSRGPCLELMPIRWAGLRCDGPGVTVRVLNTLPLTGEWPGNETVSPNLICIWPRNVYRVAHTPTPPQPHTHTPSQPTSLPHHFRSLLVSWNVVPGRSRRRHSTNFHCSTTRIM